ncbi:magnesium chelatase subunit D [Rhodobacteraceae bacterium N5(2021)]|uniref:Mg-protoporphyrin IX chelatase n=1 Tax=Gymnodinialimonas phycosphaerae TaxID=2841589 RepID=A0A975TTG8_9RHOB|nr:magnesium chelatase subunit D [Gymnodinialimonas phycosphaerae]MBY4894218.1 magnesium chelatase subunit D [Gymnodinialimonas phycosphaerae]
MSDAEARWQGINLAVACLALDPAAMGGFWIRARVGPVRDRLEKGLKTALQGLSVRRIAPTMPDEALFGGIDLAATLDTGVLTQTKGLLTDAGVLFLPMAERVESGLAGRLAGALDTGRGLSIIALDEGAEPGERAPDALLDRLAIHVDLTCHALSDAPDLAIDLDALDEARQRLPLIETPDSAIRELAEVAARLGILSLRAPLQALAVARASAALSGADTIEEPDLLTAVELVLAPRATRMPETPEDMQDDPPPPPDDDTLDAPEGDTEEQLDLPPAEILLEAARAMLPPDLLARLAAGKAARSAQASGSGATKTGNRRGRPLPPRAGRMGGNARVDLVATLRAAAPWQKIRRDITGVTDRVHVRMSDIRIRRFKETSDRAIIFVVDASGSSAMARLAEAKGAVELLLAEAYARRDHVALVAFRGDGADVLLPPTRSLVQTKRRLSSLPGGGGSPLAAGLKAALHLAEIAKGKGMTPSVALLTDGRANVDLSGAANRTTAAADSTLMARAIRAEGYPALVIDTGQRPTRGLDALAREMGAPYLPLPRADSRNLSRAVDAALTP